ncbi:hypothetical protein GCM10018793_08320 [Streptomyces sulfonofaciens]|uniref:Uncharacterized protein n=1 Tax=Streptomyces sulfonofaciens TaxID=68272 RepID=A0A919FU36_9ACTN|nr:hypothetical protein [Streptomyces sulfonofaciens]GHH72001.1 hypothetical protein GCM10018793_08320 [Streptomyces sulfonofaciens]
MWCCGLRPGRHPAHRRPRRRDRLEEHPERRRPAPPGRRDRPVSYDVLQRDETRLVRTFETTGPASATPASPLTYRLPRTTALRSLGGFSNGFANESFFDEPAHAGGHDPLELRISSLTDPRAVAVCEALRPAWQGRPRGGNGSGAGVAFQQ